MKYISPELYMYTIFTNLANVHSYTVNLGAEVRCTSSFGVSMDTDN